VLVPRQIGETFLAGLFVNQADDECPHDRTPLLIGAFGTGRLFQAGFAGVKKRFRVVASSVSAEPGRPCCGAGETLSGG
jgi:hypothetical protein